MSMSLSPQMRSESLGSSEDITSSTVRGLVVELINEQDMNKDERDWGESRGWECWSRPDRVE